MIKTKDSLFDLSGRVCVITGGAGLLGRKHAEAVLIGGGIPVLLGRNLEKLENVKKDLLEAGYSGTVECFACDITHKEEVDAVCDSLMDKYGRVDILINNAANNPKVEDHFDSCNSNGFLGFPLENWDADIAVGLTGSFFCCQVFGKVMDEQKSGVILNISSDYGILAPDQRLYEEEGLPPEKQKKKPVTYSVIKHGIIGLSKYLATYWGEKGIRCNTLCPSGIYNGQNEEFLSKYIKNIPMGRMSVPDDYIGTILYMISDASSFMNGATVVIDGGKSIW